MHNRGRWWIIAALMLLMDFYVFSAVRSLSHNNTGSIKIIVYSAYWAVSAISIIVIVLFPLVEFFQTHIIFRNYVFAVIVALLFSKLIASAFFLTDDLRRGIVLLTGKLFPKTGVDLMQEEGRINRSVLLSWLGVAFGSSLFVTLLFGFSNKYNYRVKRVQLAFENLPAAFKGLKILQVSDIHSGSFRDKEAVKRGVDMALAQEADIILFTGDLVNNKSDEMKDYMDVFNRLKAPMGVYSILGNHDYGDYVSWPDDEAKNKNLESLKKVHAELGWRLLMNEHIILKRNNEQVALLGIENWSAFARFPKHGRMDLAYPGTEKYSFKILMSHDPSHWDAEVRIKYPDIDLMLSGHTHGMQFGLQLPGFKWSPVQWFYKEWAGLYEKGKQKLYVNCGYGFLGYPGRVGIMPEITVIELV